MAVESGFGYKYAYLSFSQLDYFPLLSTAYRQLKSCYQSRNLFIKRILHYNPFNKNSTTNGSDRF
jgi:hypothetical protein